MRGLRARLKSAVKKGDVLRLGKAGWITTGHWAIHRSVLAAEGVLGEDAETDEAYLHGIGYETSDQRDSLDAAGLMERCPLDETFVCSQFSFAFGNDRDSLKTSILIGKHAVTYVQSVYLDLAGIEYGEAMKAASEKDVLVRPDKLFMVMPVCGDKDAETELLRVLSIAQARELEKESE